MWQESFCARTPHFPPPSSHLLFSTHTHTHIDLMANISMNRYRFPSKEDYSGAITAIHRLQDTYQLQPSVIASGKLGSSSAFPMTGRWTMPHHPSSLSPPPLPPPPLPPIPLPPSSCAGAIITSVLGRSSPVCWVIITSVLGDHHQCVGAIITGVLGRSSPVCWAIITGVLGDHHQCVGVIITGVLGRSSPVCWGDHHQCVGVIITSVLG